jgi:sporulation protein YlmC with PRC-barrel domain/CBS domain-containing protein
MTADAGGLRLSRVRGRRVLAADGTRLGRVVDLAFRAGEPHPPVTHVVFAAGDGARRAVGWDDVSLDEDGIRLSSDAVVDDAPPLGAPLAGRDILDAQIVDIAGKRVRRVSDVWLRADARALRIVGVDTGWRALLRRLGLRTIRDGSAATTIDWGDVHLTTSGRHALTLDMPAASLRRLPAPDLSELVARLPPDRGAAVLEAVEPGHAASALSVARPRMGGRLMQTLSPDRAGEILAEMPVDDAVAALRHVEEGHGAALLRRVPSARAAELRRLLALPPRTAGGLMTTDFRTALRGEPAQTIRARLAAAPPDLEGLTTVFVVDDAGRYVGALPPSALLAGAPPRPAPALHLDTPVDEVIDVFAVEDVLALAVIDADERIVGAVAIDDVLEELLVERLPQHRRRYRRAKVRERAPV